MFVHVTAGYFKTHFCTSSLGTWHPYSTLFPAVRNKSNWWLLILGADWLSPQYLFLKVTLWLLHLFYLGVRAVILLCSWNTHVQGLSPQASLTAKEPCHLYWLPQTHGFTINISITQNDNKITMLTFSSEDQENRYQSAVTHTI